MTESRRIRREKAKAAGVPFSPIYAPGTTIHRAKNYSKYDNKFVKVSALTKGDV